MIQIGEALNDWLNASGDSEHIPAREGDFMGPEGLLHCGKCQEGKEYRLPNGHYVPCLCRCGRIARAEEERRRREAEQMRRVRELAGFSLADERMKSARFELSEQGQDGARAFGIARRYVEHWDAIAGGSTELNGLLLYGPNGTGKSWLAGCIANALMDRGVPVLITSMTRLAVFGDDTQELIHRMSRARLLVLDDLGAERNTQTRTEQVFSVVDARYNSKLPMIVTTNYDMKAMKSDNEARYARIWERVRAMCYPVMMNSESWRKTKTLQALKAMKAMLEGEAR